MAGRALAGQLSTLSVRSFGFQFGRVLSMWCCGRTSMSQKRPAYFFTLRIAFEVLSALPFRCRIPARTPCGPDPIAMAGDPVNPELVSIVKADHDPIAFNCPAHHYCISRRSAGVCSCHRIPAAVAGPEVHTDLQIHVVAANSSENVSAADQIVGTGHCMARRADPGLDPCPIVGEPRVGIANCCYAYRVTPHQSDDIVMAPCARWSRSSSAASGSHADRSKLSG